MKKVCVLCIFFVALYACETSSGRYPMVSSSDLFFRESAENNYKLLKQEQRLIDSVIATDTIHKYQISQSGFKFYYLNRTDSEKMPQYGDRVKYRYEILNLKSVPIYSEQENGEQIYYVDQQKVFLGLSSAIKLLKEGEQAVFYIPSSLAFGYFGDRDKIGVNQPIILRLHILEIQKSENQI